MPEWFNKETTTTTTTAAAAAAAAGTGLSVVEPVLVTSSPVVVGRELVGAGRPTRRVVVVGVLV